MNNLDVPIWQLTPRQLFELQQQWLENFQKVSKKEEAKPVKVWVTLDEASSYLNRAKSTLYKYITDWQAQGAVSKVGGITLVNLEKIISLSAIKPKQTKRNYNH